MGAGFSLVELGIVIAVIAVLAGVVITGMGYFRAARQRTAVDLVLTIRGAARQYALRHQAGLRFGTSAETTVQGNVNIAGLCAEGFLPPLASLTTPWGAPDIVVAPVATPALCAGFGCVQIQMPVPAEECVDTYLVTNLQSQAVTVSCVGKTLTVVMR